MRNDKFIRNILFPTLILLTLPGCGFLTAPMGLASAEVASSTVKAADLGLESSQQAANYVRVKSATGYQISSQYIREKSIQGYELSIDLVTDLASSIRQIGNWRKTLALGDGQDGEPSPSIVAQESFDE